MFRPARSILPEDPEFPHDLEKLGYFLDEKDQIRRLTDPSKSFRYFINKNERYNEKQKEAMNACIRALVLNRFAQLDQPLGRIPLPIGSPSSSPQIQILTTTNVNSPSLERLLLVIPSSISDFCIPSYRQIANGGLAAGSFLNLVNDYLSADQEEKAVVIANTGCLLYHRRTRTNLTHASWNALPRRSAVLPSVRIDSIKNRVPGHDTPEAHISSLFNTVIANPDVVNPKAKIEIIADSDGGEATVHFLDQHWKSWGGRISAIALSNPLHYTRELDNEDFKVFLEQKSRAYGLDPQPVGTLLPPVSGTTEGFGIGCPLVSGGTGEFAEMVVLEASHGKGGMLDFLREVRDKGDKFENLEIGEAEEHDI